MSRFRLASGLSLALALALALALPLSASAQGIGQPQPTDPTGQPIDPVAQPDPPPPQPVESVAPVEASGETSEPPPPAPGSEEPADETVVNRPEGFAFGLGAGYVFPTAGGGSLLQPDIASARFRLASGLTFEPRVELSNQKSTTEIGPVESETETNTAQFSTLVRLPMVSRGKYDLELLGGAGFGVQKINPEGGDNDTTVTTLNATWGLGIMYWLKPHWGLSASALNPVILLTKTKQEGTPNQTTTNMLIGAIWEPTLAVMIHMYH